MGASRRIGLAGLAVIALAACGDDTPPPLQPAPPAPVTPPLETAAPSVRSLQLAKYYGGVQRNLVSRGLLRQDGGGPDTPFSKHQLVRNFVQIGVYNEFTLVGDNFTNQRSEGQVRRWQGPVSLSLEFGPAVAQNIRDEDTETVTKYAKRLTKITGNPVQLGRNKGNFHVAVLTVDEIAAYAPTLLKMVPGLSDGVARQITRMPRDIYCSVHTFADRDTPNTHKFAVAIIRAEHPSLLRQSCFHEEIAQGLGLPNDSPKARPSIFNDDNEFALLTPHDELLLKILYDKRLHPGTSPSQAVPIVEQIAAELLGGES